MMMTNLRCRMSGLWDTVVVFVYVVGADLVAFDVVVVDGVAAVDSQPIKRPSRTDCWSRLMVSFFRIFFFFVKKREKEKTKGNMNGPLDLSKTAFSGFHSHQCIGFYQFLPFLLGPVKADITSCSVGLSVCRFVDCRSRLASSVLTGVLFITASTKVLDLPSKISAPAQPRVI